MTDDYWQTDPLWTRQGDAPEGAMVYRHPGSAWGWRASYRCPADYAITRLWQARTLAQLAGMLPGDDGWPGSEPKRKRGSGSGRASRKGGG